MIRLLIEGYLCWVSTSNDLFEELFDVQDKLSKKENIV